MTDKVQKIKECMYSKDNFTDEDRKVLCDGCEEKCKYDKSDDFTKALAECIHNAQCNVIDPMVFAETWKDELIKLSKCEEPVSEDIQKVGSLKSLEYYPEKKTTNKTSKGVFDANMPRRKAYLRGFKDGAHAHKELIANKPVSEDLEEAIGKYCSNPDNFISYVDTGFAYRSEQKDDIPLIIKAIKFGANWQLNQIRKENEKNRD